MGWEEGARVSKAIGFCALFLLTLLPVTAEDANGKWVYLRATADGKQHPVTLQLKVEGETLTGKLIGGKGNELAISDGKVSGETLSFLVKSKADDSAAITKFDGVMEGDKLKLKITRKGPRGDESTQVTARRCPPDCP
jgi:hypothetical protein